ncbi:phosphatidate cytidylyltransferase [Mesomycoplasma lagogenitalium]|uniref:Phosphatidate cytidylyltransferase n=1 Tax=Mesomycoplasma lagogenitalium TaxID=171286 RepID=A0ABY8LW83_9BACT|nr:phosphatidate cytidylyltransferase [Mesomycoplasma lagogenitalium]WGI36387.1 phosphatidate cytidylyltransferase [Mesomycoplasma lagogenitalium]
MKNITKNKVFNRLIIVILIFAILFPIFFATDYGYLPGRIIGFIFFVALGTYGLYEVIKNVKVQNWIIYFSLIFSIIIYFLPFFVNVNKVPLIVNIIKNDVDFNLGEFKRAILLSYEEIFLIVVYFLFLMFVSLLDKANNRNFLNYFIVFFSSSFIPLFSKYMYLFNVYSVYAILAIGFIAGVSDTFGFFGGKFLGNKIFKSKLAPKISPKKTWEGAIIAFIFTFIFVFCIFYWTPLFDPIFQDLASSRKLIFSLISSFLLPIASNLGDLLFSIIKRYIKIKDFSRILGEHGGIMDRFDSTFLVVFVMVPILLVCMS